MAGKGIGTAQAALAGAEILANGANESTKLIYVLAVQYMNSRTLELAPGHDRLAGLVGCTDRTVRRCMTFLVANGLLQIKRHGNRYTPTVYTLGTMVQSRIDQQARGSEHAPVRASTADKLMSGLRIARPDI
jgi:DNA-binding IclR family transcriptional regulator